MARLKDEKRRTLSSRTWLERQLSDPYVARAKREGFRSRAAYKLAEIDDKYNVLKPGGRVVDLGAAPGGWSEIAVRRVGAAGEQSRDHGKYRRRNGKQSRRRFEQSGGHRQERRSQQGSQTLFPVRVHTPPKKPI